MEDPDFNDPPPSPSRDTTSTADPTGGGRKAFNEDDVGTLVSFGYSTEQAQGALQATDHSMERWDCQQTEGHVVKSRSCCIELYCIVL